MQEPIGAIRGKLELKEAKVGAGLIKLQRPRVGDQARVQHDVEDNDQAETRLVPHLLIRNLNAVITITETLYIVGVRITD